MPELRIISDEDWKGAHDRLNATRKVYLRGTKGELWGRPASNLTSKYLLTGLISCGICGGSLYVKSSSRKGQRAMFYGCTNHHLRGNTVCENAMQIPMEDANVAVLQVFEQQVLAPDVTKTVVRKALEKFRAVEQEWREQREVLAKQMSIVDAEIRRLVAAIAAGADVPALIEAVKEANERRETLSRDLAVLNRQQQHTDQEWDELEKELNAHFEASWKTLLNRQVEQARQILVKLFGGQRVPFIPTRLGYEFNGVAGAGKLLIGSAKSLDSRWGHHHRWHLCFALKSRALHLPLKPSLVKVTFKLFLPA
jgi:hypothetical protein